MSGDEGKKPGRLRDGERMPSSILAYEIMWEREGALRKVEEEEGGRANRVAEACRRNKDGCHVSWASMAF